MKSLNKWVTSIFVVGLCLTAPVMAVTPPEGLQTGYDVFVSGSMAGGQPSNNLAQAVNHINDTCNNNVKLVIAVPINTAQDDNKGINAFMLSGVQLVYMCEKSSDPEDKKEATVVIE